MKERITKFVKKLASRLPNTVEPIKKGESIGILGVAGTGKSRLAKKMSLTHKKLLVYAREIYPDTEEINMPKELQGYKEMDSYRLTLKNELFDLPKRKNGEYRDKLCFLIKEARHFEDTLVIIDDVEDRLLNNDELFQNTFDDQWFSKGNSLILIGQIPSDFRGQLNLLNRIVVFRVPACTLECLKLDSAKAQIIAAQECGEYQTLWNRSNG